MTTTDPATPPWWEDPDVITWDWREQPDLDQLAHLLARHGLTCAELDTGTDQHAIRITRPDQDQTPAVYALPAEPPPEVTELWEVRTGDRWERKWWPFQPDGSPAEPGTFSWMWERNGRGERQRWPGLLAYGPLSTTPPAGTEPDQ